MSSNSSSTHTAETVIRLLGDAVLAVHGSGTATFTRAERLDIAGPDAITFCKFAGPDAEARMSSCKAAVLLCGPVAVVPGGLTVIVTADPRKAFVSIVASLFTPPRRRGIHPSAVIDPEAVIDPAAYVGPNAVIGRCTVGAGTEINANVILYDGTRVGANVTIHAGTVIGADGFGYERLADGSMEKFIHLGGVVIEDDVEIGSNTSIDRGTLGDTVIRRGAKIDNQVHVAHNCSVGEDAVVIAQSMIGGSVKIGARAWIAPSTVVMNGIAIGEESFCGLGSVVTKSVADGVTVMGNPARPLDEAKALLAAQKKIIRGETQ
jgi:UDP-3-O-[3-hydroxymyristoyl] glucosamine N-acyltransferase